MSIDPSYQQHGTASAIAMAEALAKSYEANGGNVIDLFAAFAGLVVERDSAVGLAVLQAADRFLSTANR